MKLAKAEEIEVKKVCERTARNLEEGEVGSGLEEAADEQGRPCGTRFETVLDHLAKGVHAADL